ncbi:hypothetical protein CCAX7_000640 [Capsulimonas corticalis]|uniref:Uncharacterized protein n=2 Tax=Capsulimonas corticalis TaxID=2219043 RepID=A0A9N7KZD3_9BACT|nr:hypothetical protein CCAX7_000640 [Capsulimonas corticalis]
MNWYLVTIKTEIPENGLESIQLEYVVCEEELSLLQRYFEVFHHNQKSAPQSFVFWYASVGIDGVKAGSNQIPLAGHSIESVTELPGHKIYHDYAASRNAVYAERSGLVS